MPDPETPPEEPTALAAPGTCSWAVSSASMLDYHDNEWGAPVHDEQGLFERITLEGAQAGLSWALILKRRDGYRRAFSDFDPSLVARFSAADVERLMGDPGIIRNKAKIASVVSNAKVLVAMHDRGEKLGELLWSFVDDVTLHNAWRRIEEVPAVTPASKEMSARLRKIGFGFVGPTTCYATMQAAGMVNDHVVRCPRWSALGGSLSGRRRTPGASARPPR